MRTLRKDSALWPYECPCGAWHLTSIPVSAEHAGVVVARIAAHPDGPEALRILSRAGLLPALGRASPAFPSVTISSPGNRSGLADVIRGG